MLIAAKVERERHLKPKLEVVRLCSCELGHVTSLSHIFLICKNGQNNLHTPRMFHRVVVRLQYDVNESVCLKIEF